MHRNREQQYIQVPPREDVSESGPRDATPTFRIAPQIFAALSATLSALNGGFHVGWPSPSLPKLQAPDSDIPITSEQGSRMTSCLMLGSICGSLLGSFLVDRWGRKKSLLLTALPYFMGSLLIIFARSYWWFYVARFVAGLGIGISFAVLPMYVGEISEDRIRGALGAMIVHMMNAGILLVYSVGPWVDRRILAGLGGVVTVIFALVFVWIPESPYFLAMNEEPEKAKKSLTWLRGSSETDEELEAIERSVEIEQRHASSSYRELVVPPGNRKALIIIIGLLFAQQFSGIGAVLSYSSLIFAASGAKLSSSISVMITGVIQVIGGILTIFTVDLAGRRPLLLFSTLGSIVFLSGEAIYFQLQALDINVESIFWLPVTGIVGYMLSYTIGLGCLPYVVLSEILPCNVKAKASMVGAVVGALGGAIVTQFYQVITDATGIHVSFWCFAGISILSGMFIYFMVPETKRRSLREIQDEFQNVVESKPVLRSADA